METVQVHFKTYLTIHFVSGFAFIIVIIFIYTVETPVDEEIERADISEIPGSLENQLRLH